MHSPVHQAAQALLDTLVSALPLAKVLDPKDPEASVAHRLYPDDGDCLLTHYHAPGVLDTEERGALWHEHESLSAHQMVQIIPLRTRLRREFDALCAALGAAAPILSGPWLRLSVSVWRRKTEEIVVQCCLFASVPGPLSATTPDSFAADMDRLATLLAPLDAPTALYRFESDSVPLPGGDAVQAALLHAVVEAHATRLPKVSDLVHRMDQGGALTPPDARDRICADLRARGLA